MSNYRTVSMSFWSDPKVDDEFTPEDKYFYLYLITNPHTNICGCYEISMKQIERETGYNIDTIKRLISRMEKNHKVIKFNPATKEILLLNWHKHNWSKSEKLIKAVENVAPHIKCNEFREYIIKLLHSDDRSGIQYTDTDNSIQYTDTDNSIQYTDTDTDVSIPYTYPMDTLSIPYTYPMDTLSPKPESKPKNPKLEKHKHGEYQNVLLTDNEYENIGNAYGWELREKAIRFLDEYIEEKGYKSKSHNLAIRRWVMDAVKENEERANRKQNKPNQPSGNIFLQMAMEGAD